MGKESSEYIVKEKYINESGVDSEIAVRLVIIYHYTRHDYSTKNSIIDKRISYRIEPAYGGCNFFRFIYSDSIIRDKATLKVIGKAIDMAILEEENFKKNDG